MQAKTDPCPSVISQEALQGEKGERTNSREARNQFWKEREETGEQQEQLLAWGLLAGGATRHPVTSVIFTVLNVRENQLQLLCLLCYYLNLGASVIRSGKCLWSCLYN